MMEKFKGSPESMDRKLERLNNKMDKIKSFLQLTQKGKQSNLKSSDGFKRTEQSPDSGIEVEPKRIIPAEELQHLRARLRAQQKEKMSRPVLFQTLDQKSTPEFKLSEIRQLFMYALEGGNTPGLKPTWCQFERWQKISQIIIVCVENMTKKDFEEYSIRNPSLAQFMTISGSFQSEKDEFLSKNLLEYQVSNRRLAMLKNSSKKDELLIQTYKSYSDIPRPLMDPSNSSPACKMSLLMSIERMVLEKYPVQVLGSEISHYVRTKEVYSPLHTGSPLFAVDCEMCMTSTNRHELTRVSIVNENLQVVYDTYVKPYNPVINYLTRYSGITKSILDPVKTRLHDVQAALRKLLPGDAILCGQSLNGDLHALEMLHPYVIDTSIIFNLNGNPRHKSSLKLLSEVFLSKSIQGSGKLGHDSVEDSRTTMELVLLKLKHGPGFGDVTSGWRLRPNETSTTASISGSLDSVKEILETPLSKPFPVAQPESAISFPAKRKHTEPEGSVQEFTRDTPKTSCHYHQSLLKCAADMKKKYVVVGSSSYIQNVAEKDKKVVVLKSAKKVLKTAEKSVSGQDLLFCEVVMKLYGTEEDKQAKIDSTMRKIWRLFSAASDRSLCGLALSGNSSSDSAASGICFANLKNSVSMSFFNSDDSAVVVDHDLD